MCSDQTIVDVGVTNAFVLIVAETPALDHYCGDKRLQIAPDVVSLRLPGRKKPLLDGME